MLIDRFEDKDKLVPEFGGINIEGTPVRRQRGMIYWYRWGRHTFDVRVMRKLLGLEEKSDADMYFMESSAYFNRSGDAFVDIVAQLRDALGDRSFKALMSEHDKAVEAA